MEQPKIEIRYVDNTEADGYLRIVVNGFIQPSIRVHFDVGNEATLQTGLHKALTHVYETAYRDGERAAKRKVCDLLDWIKCQ